MTWGTSLKQWFGNIYMSCRPCSREIIRVVVSHPGVAENIAPVWGPGSDVIVEGIPPRDNSWVQDGSFCTMTKVECYLGVAKVWPISSGQLWVWSVTSWTPNGCNILCYPGVVCLSIIQHGNGTRSHITSKLFEWDQYQSIVLIYS